MKNNNKVEEYKEQINFLKPNNINIKNIKIVGKPKKKMLSFIQIPILNFKTCIMEIKLQMKA